MVSVSSEAASNLAFQGAPLRAERSHQPPANDLFDALVSHNTAPDQVSAPPAPSPRRSDEKPPPAEAAATAANSPTNPPHGNDAARGTDSNAPPANANANTSGADDGGAHQSQAAKTAGTKDDPAKTADQQKSGDTPSDPTILVQQATVTAPIPVPVAVAVSVNTAPTNVAAASTSGGSTPPLAIAAAAIAATSQTLSGQVTTPAQGKTDSTAGPTATSGSAAAKAPALSAPGIKVAASVASSSADASPVISQARQFGTAPANAATLNGVVAAAALAGPKTTSDKTSVSSAASDNPDDADPTATNPSALIAQNGQQQQPAATGKADATNAAVPLATSDAAASSSSPSSAHEHVPVANAGHPPTESVDPPALGALQVQPNSAAAPATGGTLSVATAANGPVPLSGLALEIAASIKSGKSRFEIRLDPADLGRIDVRIDIDRNGQVTSHLTVEKPETLSILRQDAPQLQRALDDAGVKTGSGGLQFSLRDQSSSGQNNGGDPRPNVQRLVITDEDTVPAAVAGRSYGRSLGASGGVDIRV